MEFVWFVCDLANRVVFLEAFYFFESGSVQSRLLLANAANKDATRFVPVSNYYLSELVWRMCRPAIVGPPLLNLSICSETNTPQTDEIELLAGPIRTEPRPGRSNQNPSKRNQT